MTTEDHGLRAVEWVGHCEIGRGWFHAWTHVADEIVPTLCAVIELSDGSITHRPHYEIRFIEPLGNPPGSLPYDLPSLHPPVPIDTPHP